MRPWDHGLESITSSSHISTTMDRDEESLEEGWRLPFGIGLPDKASSFLNLCSESLNFYRVHVIYFTIVRTRFVLSDTADTRRLP